MRRLCLLALGSSLVAGDLPRICYSKSFPGSVPAYVSITLDQNGGGEYKEAPEDDQPLSFQMADTDTAEMFALAKKLNHFSRPLESNLKVANMGLKTFCFEHREVKHEVKFNFTEEPEARLLVNWFERISETEQYLIQLDRAARYDKLGVNQALLMMDAAIARKRLVALDQLLPILDRIANNETYMHIARARAAGLAEAVRARKPK